MNRYEVFFFNRFANEYQVFKVMAKNKYRAGRIFYIRHNRKTYFDCIEWIQDVNETHFWTEEEAIAFRNRRKS